MATHSACEKLIAGWAAAGAPAYTIIDLLEEQVEDEAELIFWRLVVYATVAY
jgi:hypothetical protein